MNKNPKNSFSVFSARTTQVKAKINHTIKIIVNIVFSPFFYINIIIES